MEGKSRSSVPRKSLNWISPWMSCIAGALRSVRIKKTPRNLEICETLSLGDRRMLLVVQVDRRRFLIGATNQSIALLDRLDERPKSQTRSSDAPRVDGTWRGIH